ncbi:MAG: cysteine desulfurase family protein [Candidatus Uhrbacteria bacterium]
MKDIYLDHAATTPLDVRVQEAMKPYLQERYGNPSSFHSTGKLVKDDLDQARSKIAKLIGARTSEVIFTSGGTESDNLALLGFARKNQNKGKHIITTRIEHHAVLHTTKQLEKEGFEVTCLGVDQDGLIDPKQVVAAIRPDTILISIIYANNEIGVIQPISEIGNIIEKYRRDNQSEYPVLHTDACQAAGALEIDVQKIHVDMMTLNGSKIYGPKGVGLLYKRRELKIEPLMYGGGQESGVRSGTENIAGIIGLTKALEIALDEQKKESDRLVKLRDRLIVGIKDKILKVRLNGHATKRLPNNVNMSIGDVEGEALLLYLDAQGIYCSTGSACTSTSLDPSHVLLALGLPAEVAHSSLRLTLGRSTTEKDVDYVLEVLPGIVEKLRKISPVKVDKKYFV